MTAPYRIHSVCYTRTYLRWWGTMCWSNLQGMLLSEISQ